MKKASVYTRSGDKGLTGLVGGTRISKGDSRIHLYGEVDELNSHIGVALSFVKDEEKVNVDFIKKIQSRLFDVGSQMACELDKREVYKLPTIKAENIVELEKEIDLMDSILSKMTHFILPGGTHSASYFHVCRTVTRKIERELVAKLEEESDFVSEEILKYFNRLSDYFFILSRYINQVTGIEEVKWIPENQ